MGKSERWVAVLHGYDSIVEVEGKEDDENFVADCGAGDEGEAYAKRIVADHNGCLGIKDPATTVPELVDTLKNCHEAIAAMFNGPPGPASASSSCVPGQMEWTVLHAVWQHCYTVLAKTGKKTGEPG